MFRIAYTQCKLHWIGTALTSLLIYVAAVWSTGQHLESQYYPEQPVIAAALSHAIHGAPFGSVHEKVIWPLLYRPGNNIQQTLATLTSGTSDRTALGPMWDTVPDGLGILLTAAVSILFDLFGVTLAVFPILAVAFSTVSVICIVMRFSDARLFVVPLHFLVLTALLFSPIGTELPLIGNFSIGGIRYMSLLAILPAIHIVLELIDCTTVRFRVVDKLATAIQIVTFVFCLGIRGSSVYLLLAVLTLAGVMLWTKARTRWRQYAIKLCSIVSVLIVTAAVVYVAAPAEYRRDGRVTENYWHRIFISLGTNPEWPFGNIKEKYDLCVPPYGLPMQAGVVDSNGNCVWAQYVRSAGLPEDLLFRGLHGAAYDELIRETFIQIVLDYPSEVLATFAYYKLAEALPNLKGLLKFSVDLGDRSCLVRLLCLIGLLAIVVWSGWFQTLFRFRQLAAACALFLLWSMFPIVVARGETFTMVDVAYWCWMTFSCIALMPFEFGKWAGARPKATFRN